MAQAYSRSRRIPIEVKSWRWQKIMGSKVLVLSVLLLLFLGMGAAYVVISRMETKRKLTFNAGPPTTNPSKRPPTITTWPS